jgi:hypothetical protein
MSLSRTIVSTFVTVIVSLVVAELVARTVFGLKPLVIQTPYPPIYALAEFDNLSTNAEMAHGPSGPLAYGYEEGVFGYYYDGRTPPPRSSTNLSDFLFRHTLSRYDAATIDRLACEQPNAAAIYVLGGSVAQGHSAQSKAATWHALLEGKLRRQLQRDDIYLFNGAMGGYLSLQDKMAYYLAAVPRNARAVLILNSQNDLVVPLSSGTRPGDPFVLGVRFGQFFTDGFFWWLAKHSAIVNALLQSEVKQAIQTYRQRLNEDDAAFAQYATAVMDIYFENMHEVLGDCAIHGRACLVAIQPSRNFTAINRGFPADDVLSEKRMRSFYEMLKQRVARSPYRERFVDLTGVFDRSDMAEIYTDGAHFSERGQTLLADELMRPALGLLTDNAGNAMTPGRCRRLSI